MPTAATVATAAVFELGALPDIYSDVIHRYGGVHQPVTGKCRMTPGACHVPHCIAITRLVYYSNHRVTKCELQRNSVFSPFSPSHSIKQKHRDNLHNGHPGGSRSAAACMLALRVRIPLRASMFFSCVSCVLCSALCDGLVTPEESSLLCVI